MDLKAASEVWTVLKTTLDDHECDGYKVVDDYVLLRVSPHATVPGDVFQKASEVGYTLDYVDFNEGHIRFVEA